MSVFCFMVTTAPHHNQVSTVCELIQATFDSGHSINGLFFYQDGVLAANNLVNMPSDEYQFIESLLSLKAKYGFPLHLCITAAEKRGLTDSETNNNIDEHFIVSGLGEMVELSSNADRVIQL